MARPVDDEAIFQIGKNKEVRVQLYPHLFVFSYLKDGFIVHRTRHLANPRRGFPFFRPQNSPSCKSSPGFSFLYDKIPKAFPSGEGAEERGG